MANIKFRVAPLYVGSKKVAEMQNATFDIDSGDEQEHGVDAVLGFTEGIITGKVSCETCVPVGGQSVPWKTLILNKTDVNVGLDIDGGLLQATGRVTSLSYKTDSKTGKTTSTPNIVIGTPTDT